MAEPDTPAFQRLDRWLWCARFAKSRSLAAKLCAGGLVTLGGAAVSKAHQPVKIGDRLVLRLGRWERRIEVRALGLRRGPAKEARTLYSESEPPRPAETPAETWESLFEDDDGSRSPPERGSGRG